MLTRSGYFFVTALLACEASQAVPSYTSIEIPSPAGPNGDAVATGINHDGDIVASYTPNPGSSPIITGAFVYHHNNGSEFILPGTDSRTSISANGINNLDQVAGIRSGDTVEVEAVEWQKNGSFVPLPTNTLAEAVAINNNGDIVGNEEGEHENGIAVMWTGPTHQLTVLGVLWSQPYPAGYDSSAATAINTAGHITGLSDAGEGTDINTAVSFGTHAFLYRNGKMLDLGALAHFGNQGTDYSGGFGINDLDEVVGVSKTNIPGLSTTGQPCSICGMATHAFLWKAGNMTDLGNLAGIAGLDSLADAINDKEEIVGWSDQLVNGIPTHRAFVYVGGQMSELQYDVFHRDPNVRLTEAVSINCRGWIVANGFNTNTPSVKRVYLLIPR